MYSIEYYLGIRDELAYFLLMAVSDVRWYVLSSVTRPKACSLEPPSSMIPLEGGEVWWVNRAKIQQRALPATTV